MTQFEKRSMERFRMKVLTSISKAHEDEQQKMEFFTNNICAGGAFYRTEKLLDIGTEVNLDLVLPHNKLSQPNRKRTQVSVSGKVIRANYRGMAIKFNKNYSFS